MWHHYMEKEWGSWSGFVNHEVPIWLASITSFLVTYGFGLALVTGFAFYQRLRDSQLRSAALERALTQAHLAALRMQLSPHTLFNLLHTIRGQISWDPPAAQAMVVQLGDLLRRLLNAIAPGKPAGRIGIGLANVRERLEVQFGAAATFSAGPADDNLWLAEVHMPLLRDGPGAPGGEPLLAEGD